MEHVFKVKLIKVLNTTIVDFGRSFAIDWVLQTFARF